MCDEPKKISFGFSKLSKKTSIVSSHRTEVKSEEKVEFIDCLVGKSIKLKDAIKPVDNTLIIPLKKTVNLAGTSIENQVISQDKNNTLTSDLHRPDNTFSRSINDLNRNIAINENIITKEIDKGQSPTSEAHKNETLEEIAAREILEDLNKEKAEEVKVFNVPLTSNAPSGEKESTLEDYENIPVEQYGIAMLRGMGWAPGKGIGKNEKLITPSLPAVRPKGMGLGADKVIKSATVNNKTDEDLKMIKGSFVRVIAGSHKDCYGHIEGFDEESSRLIVKLALKNATVSLNEFMVQLVDKKEFSKNSKVINVCKYEQYKKDSEQTVCGPIEKKEFVDSNKKYQNNKIKCSVKSAHSKSSKHSSSSESESSDKNKEILQINEYSTKSYPKSLRTTLTNKGRGRDASSSNSPSNSSQEQKLKHSTSRSKCQASNYNKEGFREDKLGSNHSSRSKTMLTNRSSSVSSTDSDIKNQTQYTTKSKSKINRARSSSFSRSPVKTDDSSGYSRSRKHRTKKKKPSSHRDKSRSRSRSPVSTDSSSDYSRNRKHRTKKKKPSSHKPKSRSRSRSPRKHSSHKKHKKSKYS